MSNGSTPDPAVVERGMSPRIEGPVRIFISPVGGEMIGMTSDGTPVTASGEHGVGPMAEITQYVTDIVTDIEVGS